jgi:pimeloyl-ACP methyl ester carboxylesterase
MNRTLLPALFLITGCLSGNTNTIKTVDPATATGSADALMYRDDMGTHPGCTTAGLSYTPASIAGYTCAAKEYTQPNEDTSKPIVVLVHGNSSTPADYETFTPTGGPAGIKQLSERLIDSGYRVIAVDLRIDKTDDPTGNNATQNAAHNIDHGWATPITQSLIGALIDANPTRQISVVGFSLGSTIARDALRRLHRAGKKPFEHVKDVVLAAGAEHGVSTFRALCGDPTNPTNPTMRGRVACELGDRTAYTETAFHAPLNGGGAYETPCADGKTAYGQTGVCGGKTVRYTTIVMKDKPDGTYQDEFVSVASSLLAGADNKNVELTDNDLSGYFYNGLFKNHYGSLRSEAALTIITTALARP